MSDNKVAEIVMAIERLDAEQKQSLCNVLAIVCNAEMRIALKAHDE